MANGMELAGCSEGANQGIVTQAPSPGWGHRESWTERQQSPKALGPANSQRQSTWLLGSGCPFSLHSWPELSHGIC